jgi:chemotaxis protein methyltransferase CheR
MNDQQFRQLLHRYQYSWKGYRKVRKSVKKRIRRYMTVLGCHTIEHFLAELDINNEARDHCERLMTVSISRFFRDRALWEALKEQILPEFMNAGKNKVRFWSAGCACGEEVYSFKIIWDWLSSSYFYVPDLEVLATDINPIHLDRARKGIYPPSSLKEATKEIYSKYFEQKGGQQLVNVKSSLKKGITWENRHLLSDPPDSDFDVIFLRNNVLTYYADPMKIKAFRNVLSRLKPFGILVLGSHEKVPFETQDLANIEPYSYVLRKRGKKLITVLK